MYLPHWNGIQCQGCGGYSTRNNFRTASVFYCLHGNSPDMSGTQHFQTFSSHLQYRQRYGHVCFTSCRNLARRACFVWTGDRFVGRFGKWAWLVSFRPCVGAKQWRTRPRSCLPCAVEVINMDYQTSQVTLPAELACHSLFCSLNTNISTWIITYSVCGQHAETAISGYCIRIVIWIWYFFGLYVNGCSEM